MNTYTLKYHGGRPAFVPGVNNKGPMRFRGGVATGPVGAQPVVSYGRDRSLSARQRRIAKRRARLALMTPEQRAAATSRERARARRAFVRGLAEQREVHQGRLDAVVGKLRRLTVLNDVA